MEAKGLPLSPELKKKFQEFRAWLGPNLDEAGKVSCTWCKKRLSPTKLSLRQHGDTKKHRRNTADEVHTALIQANIVIAGSTERQNGRQSGGMPLYSTPKPRKAPSTDGDSGPSASQASAIHGSGKRKNSTYPTSSINKTRRTSNEQNLAIAGSTKEDVKLVTYSLRLLLCSLIHNDALSGNHFSQITEASTPHFNLMKFNAHKTRCVKILTHVLLKHIQEELYRDIGDQPYSVLMEEFSCRNSEGSKFFCICIRYFSVRENRIADRFLEIIKVENGFDRIGTITEYLSKSDLSLEKMIVFAAEANNPISVNSEGNSLWEILKQKNIQLVRYLPHSLDVCISNVAGKCQPFIDCYHHCRDVCNYFTQEASAKRSQFFGEININMEDNFNKGLPSYLKSWLAGRDIIHQIMTNWDEFKGYFNQITQPDDFQKRIQRTFNDHASHLYFIVISNVLGEIQSVDSQLKETEVNIVHIYSDLYKLLLGRMRQIINNDSLANLQKMSKSNFEQIEEILNEPLLIAIDSLNYGREFQEVKDEILKSSPQDADKTKDVQRMCQAFILDLCREIIRRFPPEMNVLITLNKLSQSLPSINSAVEKAFSLTMSLMKKMQDEIPVSEINAIIHIKHYFSLEGKNCDSFEPEGDLLKELNSVECDKKCDNGGLIWKLIHSIA